MVNNFDEDRMDIIGQNGNDGTHYEMSRIATLRQRIDMLDEEQIETLEDNIQTTPEEEE
tara:strand:- start:30624 stop:30800 length:177 start_codon:yes stop_codon:yes gene_type:complete